MTEPSPAVDEPNAAPAEVERDAPAEAARDEPAEVERDEPAEAARDEPAEVRPARPRRWLRRTLLGVGITVLVLALVATGLVFWSVRRAFPQLGGDMALPGLSAPVTVYRDQYGIPQLYADTAEDLFRAQGFVHAQDRFWEMDFRRHVTAGRVSELVGESQLATDAFLRTLGWRHVAEREWSLLSAETRSYLEAYSAGVNAWIDQTGGASPSGDKSLEYTLLGLLNRSYTIEPWNPVDSLAWLKAMAWDLRGNMVDEIERAVLLASGLTRDQVDELYPRYPYRLHQPIVRDSPDGAPVGPRPLAQNGTIADLTDAGPVLARLADALATLPKLFGDGPGVGSNSWVVSGEHTTTGKPLLANDPHLSPSMPGIWYQIGLHCRCDFDVAGFSFSGVPGVIIGHNDRIAWGFTNLGPDVTDLYLEQIDGNNVFDGIDWVPVTTREEVIAVAGADPVTITVRSTRHGPIMSDRSQEMLTIGARPAVDPSGSPLPTVAPEPTPSLDPVAPGVPEPAAESPYAVALRWTALDPNATFDAIFALNRATDWESFRAAAARFTVPAQNLVYADVDGNIGYQAPGRIPIRGAGDGTWPAPGWDPAYDWEGFIPFDELPSVYNPAEGWIVTANQAVVGPAYPYVLTQDWDYGYRSQRIVELLTERLAAGNSGSGQGGSAGIDVAAFRRLQFDNHNGLAPALIDTVRDLRSDPAMAGVPPAAVDLLLRWDLQQTEDSAGAALFNAFYLHLLARTFDDELPEDRRPGPGNRWWVVLEDLMDEPRSPWWDDTRTLRSEDLADTVGAALADAVAELRSQQGDDPTAWRWGDLHTLTLTHASFGRSGIAPIEWLFNRGPVGTSGGDSTVNATGWDPSVGYEVRHVPSMRMIVDLSDLDASRWIQLTGNSGHAFHPNYDDQFPLWRVGQDLPMYWSRTSNENAATHTLTLRPALALQA